MQTVPLLLEVLAELGYLTAGVTTTFSWRLRCRLVSSVGPWRISWRPGCRLVSPVGPWRISWRPGCRPVSSVGPWWSSWRLGCRLGSLVGPWRFSCYFGFLVWYNSHHCGFDGGLNLCTRCSCYNRWIILSTSGHEKVLSVRILKINRLVRFYRKAHPRSMVKLERVGKFNQVLINSFFKRRLLGWFSQAQVSFIIQQFFFFFGNPGSPIFSKGDVTPIQRISLPIHWSVAILVLLSLFTGGCLLVSAGAQTLYSLAENNRGPEWFWLYRFPSVR